jgi:hypothetical protein
MLSLRLLNFAAASYLIYQLYYRAGAPMQVDYKSPTFIVLAILILVNGYQLLMSSMREGFVVPRDVIDISNIDDDPKPSYIQTGNKLIWDNNSSEPKELVGDEFGKVTIAPGTSFKHMYKAEGVYRYVVSDKPDAVGLVHVTSPDYVLPASYYDKTGSGYSTDYYINSANTFGN